MKAPRKNLPVFEPGDVIVAFDPSPSNIGIAITRSTWRHISELATVDGIECLSACPLLETLRKEAPRRLWVVIERPAGIFRGSQQVRAVAVRVRELLRKQHPKRARIVFVDPRTWQSFVLKGVEAFTGKDSDTKARSLWVARCEMGLEVLNDHEADAACLLKFACCRFPEVFR